MDLADLLSKEWWKGTGGIVAVASLLVAIVGLVLGLVVSSGGSSNTNSGNCNAQGNGNTVCSGPASTPSR